jgi:hypothetical protein
MASIFEDNIIIDQNNFIIPENYDMKLISHLFSEAKIKNDL